MNYSKNETGVARIVPVPEVIVSVEFLRIKVSILGWIVIVPSVMPPESLIVACEAPLAIDTTTLTRIADQTVLAVVTPTSVPSILIARILFSKFLAALIHRDHS